MSDFHLTAVDFVVIAVIVISAMSAIARGFVRETLSVFAWAAAVFATVYFAHYAVPWLAPHFSPMIAEVLAYSAVFVIVLIPLSLIGSQMARQVQSSGVGAFDRSLGGVFGIVRGLAVVAAGYIVFSMAIPVRAQPVWVSHAQLLPLVQRSADFLLSLIPSDDATYLQHRTGLQAPVPGNSAAAYPQPNLAKFARDRKIDGKGYGLARNGALDTRATATRGEGGT